MKNNFCEIKTFCVEPKPKKCVYFVAELGHEDCKYMDGEYCDSKVAQVNVITVTLNKLLKRESK